MSEYVPNTAHVEQGLDRLLERFKGRPKLEALLRILLARMQHIDDVIFDLFEGFWIDNAVGSQLDALGWIVGEERLGRSDDIYRLYIRARIRINRSNGRVSDTLLVARLILEADATIEYVPEYPAAYRVRISDTLAAASDLRRLLVQVKPAGVGLTVDVINHPELAFIWDTATPAANGWDAGLWADDA